VIGNFKTEWQAEHDPLLDQITNLICYDVDAMLSFPKPIPARDFCLFASNTHTDLVPSIKDRLSMCKVFYRIHVCADAEGRTDLVTLGADHHEEAISGLFIAGSSLFSLTAIPSNALRFQSPGSNYGMYIFGCR
jgi:hypothetical protein